jgi:cytoskeletal protein CcmA (bactofilin family)
MMEAPGRAYAGISQDFTHLGWNVPCDAAGHAHLQNLQEKSMNNGAHVGSSVVIKGELSAKEDIRIAGRVEGRVDVDGYTVTLEEGGQLHADVSASGIIVAGNVKGSLVAERRIELRPSASFQGDMVAPVVRVDDGALVQGKLDIEGSRKPALARAS